jgi:ABC-type polysaccharide/polyol phosphate export permease
LREYARSLYDRRRFMVEMAKADLRGTRSSTVLGSLWGILDPAFQAAIYFLLFTIIRAGGRPLDFLHVLIAGIFLFQLATSSLNEGGNSIRQSKNLMLNSAFPRALLPMSTLYKAVLRFLPTIGVYVVAHVILQAPVGWGLLLLPVLFALQLVLMLGISLLVSTITVYFQDAKNVVSYITRLLFFTTPVIYPLSLLPENLRSVLSFQPFFALFASYQKIFDGGAPSAFDFVQVALWAAFFLVVGAWVFLRHERNFAIHL